MGDILRLWCERVMWLMDWMLLRCFFLTDEVEPPLVNPSDMVFVVPWNWGGSTWLMFVWVGGWSLRLLSGWRVLLWWSRVGMRLSNCLWWDGPSFLTNRRRWTARINSSILSWSALHSSVGWPLFRWYLQYLVMLALGGFRVLRGGGIRSA